MGSARWRHGFARLRAATSSAMLAGLIGGFLVVALLISGTLQARTRLSNWDPEYPLLIGNEQTGDRPWRGRLFALEITDAATPAASVRRFSAGEPVVLPGAPIAAFDFNGSPPYKDASGNLRGSRVDGASARTGRGRRLAGRPVLAAKRRTGIGAGAAAPEHQRVHAACRVRHRRHGPGRPGADCFEFCQPVA